MADYIASPAFASDCADILRAIQDARATRRWEAPQLRASVESCARDARLAGCPPERLVVGLKAFFRSGAVAEIGEWFRGVLADRAISWAIQAYYEVPDP